MSKTLDYAVQFANFCKNEKFDPIKLRELIEAVLRRAGTSERECNYGDRDGGKYVRADRRAIEKVQKIAAEMGLVAHFPGLYAMFVRKRARGLDTAREPQLHLPLPE